MIEKAQGGKFLTADVSVKKICNDTKAQLIFRHNALTYIGNWTYMSLDIVGNRLYFIESENGFKLQKTQSASSCYFSVSKESHIKELERFIGEYTVKTDGEGGVYISLETGDEKHFTINASHDPKQDTDIKKAVKDAITDFYMENRETIYLALKSVIRDGFEEVGQ